MPDPRREDKLPENHPDILFRRCVAVSLHVFRDVGLVAHEDRGKLAVLLFTEFHQFFSLRVV